MKGATEMVTKLTPRSVTKGGWDARLWTLLFVLSGNMLIDALEVSVVLPALPAIADDFELPLWQVQLVMSGFALGFGSLLLLGPRVTAYWGKRRVYLIALLVFAAASLIGGWTTSWTVLVLTRIVKGTCAALTAPVGLAIINATFSEGPDQRRAVSFYSMFGAAGFTGGLALAAALNTLSWRWLFVVPALAALVLAPFAARVIPAQAPARIRPPGNGPSSRVNGPLVRSAVGAAVLNGTYLSTLLLLTFELRGYWDWDRWQVALAFLPACLPLALSSPFTGRIVERFGTRSLIALGAMVATAGYAFRLTPFAAESYSVGVLPTLLLVGAGFVLSFGALNMRATSRVSPQGRERAVAMYQSAVQFSAVIMLSLVTVVLTVSEQDRPALLLITAVGVVGVLVAITGRGSDEATRQEG
ncbi:MFS transporter [Actinopolyspora sp. H202]|uniref:MFS transporter n=1 Tax=Actinopolyspora sp. H202 TaxID=1500456 RepID=UPI003EE62ADA